MLTSCVIMSFCAFDIFTAESYFSLKFIAKIQFTVYAILEIAIFTRAAENIRRESERIAEKIYNSSWYKVRRNNKNLQQMILISMQCATQPVKMTAMGFSDMTFQTFVNVFEGFKLKES